MNTNPPEPDPPKIIPISPGMSDALEILKKQDKQARACPLQHRHIVVDEKNRTITCNTCGFTLDPFDYILQWANEGERRMEALKAVKIQTRIANAELHDLTRKIRNARNTLKRAGQPQTPKERRHYDEMRWNPNKVDDPNFRLIPSTHNPATPHP